MDAERSAQSVMPRGVATSAHALRTDALRMDVASALREVRRRKTRVHSLTSIVAANLTANVLLAAGANPSLTQNIDDLPDFVRSADALLINLGMLDQSRREAVAVAAPLARALGKPIVLDPVYIDRAGPRRQLALSLLDDGVSLLKLNGAEARALPPLSPAIVRVETGTIDRIEGTCGLVAIDNGHPVLAQVTATGCALGAVMAACAAVAAPTVAALAALGLVNVAAEDAATRATGPGSFVPFWLDAIAGLTPDAVATRIRFVEGARTP